MTAMVLLGLGAGVAGAQATAAPTITSPTTMLWGYAQPLTLAVLYGDNFDASTTITVGGYAPPFFDPTPNSPGAALIGVDTSNGIPFNGQTLQDVVICNEIGCTTYPQYMLFSNGHTPVILGTIATGEIHIVNPFYGEPFIINGYGFTQVDQVLGCGLPITFDVEDDTQIAFATGPYRGSLDCDLTVISSTGESATLRDAYQYAYALDSPSIQSVTPDHGPLTGGTTIELTGPGMNYGSSVTIGGISVAANYIDNEHITVVTPAYVSGPTTVNIVVVNGQGTGVKPGGFTYEATRSIFLAVPSAGVVASLLTDGLTQTGLTNGGGRGAAVDSSGDVWTLGLDGQSLVKYSKSGAVLATYDSIAGFSTPKSLAIDGAGTVWAPSTNTLWLNAVAPSGSYIGGGAGLGYGTIGAGPDAIAIDQAGGIWIASKTANQITHMIGTAQPVLTPTAAAVTNSTLGTKP